MSCKKLNRQSLYMVLSGGRDMYSLSRMNISGLFYPSMADADAAQAKANKTKNAMIEPEVLGSIGCLPVPSVHYQPFRPSKSDSHSSMDMFVLFGKNKILCSDAMGYTSVYNTRLHSFLGMPMLNSPKGPKRVAVYIPRTAAHAKSDFEIDPKVDSDVFVRHRMVTTLIASTSWTWTVANHAASRHLPSILWGAGAGVHYHHRHS